MIFFFLRFKNAYEIKKNVLKTQFDEIFVSLEHETQ